MAFEALQKKICQSKTPVALGLKPDIEKVSPKIRGKFEEMFGPGMMADAESLRYHGSQLLDAAQGKMPAVVIDADSYIKYGMMGMDVLWNLVSAAKAHEFYTILDCRTTKADFWCCNGLAPDAVTVMPYVGSDCLPEEQSVEAFAIVRTANESADSVQTLRAGDRPFYAVVAEQMSRKGAGLTIETGFSLDIREIRKRCPKAFLLLPNCDGDNATPAFDAYGHGAMVVDYSIQYGAQVEDVIKEMKKWVMIL